MEDVPTLEACRNGPAVFLGAVGDPRADGLPPSKRPEAALLALRSTLGCFANLRPARVDPELVAKSALREEVAGGADLVIVRELTGGLYYGEPRGRENGRAVNTLVYTEEEVRRVARVAFELARTRRKRVTSVDKANVLEVSQLWRAVVDDVAKEYDDVDLDHMLVDRAAMEPGHRPRHRPRAGLTQPGMTIVCGDSHTSTHGAFGALAFGIGTSEVEHVLATQTLIQQKAEEHARSRSTASAARRPASPPRTSSSRSSARSAPPAAPATSSSTAARRSARSRWRAG
jgi:hypothetical protein